MSLHFQDFLHGDLGQARSFLAFSLGYAHVMCHATRQLGSYHDLLADESRQWDQASHDFLQQSGLIINQLQQWSENVLPLCQLNIARENLSLTPILTGIADQCHKLAPHLPALSITLSGSHFVHADPYLLQQAMTSIIFWLYSQQRSPSTPLHLHGGTVNLSNHNISYLRSQCPPGNYIAIGASLEDLSFSDYISAAAVLSSQAQNSLHLEAMQWLGIAKLHHGDLFLHINGPQHGLAMILEPAIAAPAEKPEQVSHHETILLVDDEDMIWDVISDMLKALGYTVLLAANGREAVEIYQNNPGQIDLVLLDMVMPEMNAREAFHVLKQINPEVKVLLSSGFVSEADSQDLLAAGAQGFLRKPYSMRVLARKIRDIIDA